MKLLLRPTIILFAFIFLYAANIPAQNGKKHINASLNIYSAVNDTLKRSNFNLGIISNIDQLGGAGINLISNVVRTNTYGLQTSGLVNITGNDFVGLQLAGLANINGNNSTGLIGSGLVNITSSQHQGLLFSGGVNIIGESYKGLTLGGLLNITGNNSFGAQFSTIGNITGENMNGLSLSGLLNVTGQDMNGIQATALLNVNGDELKGVQLAGISNVSVDLKGVQIGALSNIVASEMSGIQLGAATNISMKINKGVQLAGINICMREMKGAQVGAGNYSTEVKGAQLGLLNVCAGEVKGVQIGLINHSKDTSAVKIGLVNVNPKTRIQLLAYGGNVSKANLAVRFQNRLFYNTLGIGTHYLGLNEKFSGAFFYRTGIHFSLWKKIDLSGDLGYYHIENFENESATVPERMYSLQARVNLEYHPINKLGIFASGGYSVTRYYNQNRMFEHKPIFELGLVIF